ncbi:hypothetical protein AURDEDRAFT_163609 [Auricularia subglabra TFB-10046 SS5]|nr:hypothetical protein AURDEDRAFT_163609 [Auricularia subglabra TFB-10046 SS5]
MLASLKTDTVPSRAVKGADRPRRSGSHEIYTGHRTSSGAGRSMAAAGSSINTPHDGMRQVRTFVIGLTVGRQFTSGARSGPGLVRSGSCSWHADYEPATTSTRAPPLDAYDADRARGRRFAAAYHQEHGRHTSGTPRISGSDLGRAR